MHKYVGANDHKHIGIQNVMNEITAYLTPDLKLLLQTLHIDKIVKTFSFHTPKRNKSHYSS